MVNSIGLEGSDYVSDNIHQVSHLLSGIHLTGFGNEVARPGQNPPRRRQRHRHPRSHSPYIVQAIPVAELLHLSFSQDEFRASGQPG